jgi:hypothetical protein
MSPVATRTLVVEQDLGRGKTRKYFHAQCLGPGTEPTAQIGE